MRHSRVLKLCSADLIFRLPTSSDTDSRKGRTQLGCVTA